MSKTSELNNLLDWYRDGNRYGADVPSDTCLLFVAKFSTAM